ncbi:MAG: acyltransferase [Puia sp.]|nr:acyltransferase [Puia sp.]
MSRTYLKGLNTLRFFAAFFVIISHGQISLYKMGLPDYINLPVFNRGSDAVEFFFTLSGFLITYLLQAEIRQSGTVSIRAFYWRRVFRIWPLYFLIVFIGFLLLGWLYPTLTGQPFFEFPLLKGLLLFICFLPNLATTLYPAGMLYPLWSIGVEEQYYLFWAPLVKIFRNRLFGLVILFFFVSCAWYYVVSKGLLPLSDDMRKFFITQKFYAMATGGVFGLILARHPEQYKRSFLAGKFAQVLLIGLLIGYYLLGIPFAADGVLLHFLLSILYGILILNSSAIEKPVINLEREPFVYLGKISYGLYMYHMLADYILRFALLKMHVNTKVNLKILMPFYHMALLGGAILLASLSYKYIESYFLRLKGKYIS